MSDLVGFIYFIAIVIYAAFTYAAMSATLALIYNDQRWRKDGEAPPVLPV